MEGPVRSKSTAMFAFRAAAWLRTRFAISAAHSCLAWLMLRRKTLVPSSMSFPIISSDSVAGPKVMMIFVLRDMGKGWDGGKSERKQGPRHKRLGGSRKHAVAAKGKPRCGRISMKRGVIQGAR